MMMGVGDRRKRKKRRKGKRNQKMLNAIQEQFQARPIRIQDRQAWANKGTV